MPSLAVVLAYAGACGGDVAEWERRWHGLAVAVAEEGDVPGDAVVPRQLPMVERHFTGRTAELAALTRLLDGAEPAPGAVPVVAVDGTAGVGKTALAVYWAHQVAGRFPDGQLYVNLQGFAPGGAPLPPGKVIRGFLDALRVPPHRIPPDLAAQAALYRTLLAERRMLILLDNAADAGQVRPLLPASSGCLVLVTGRARLGGLLAREGAHPLTLGVLSTADAREMLARQVGAERLAAELDAADDLIAQCAGLPLALAIAGARAVAHPRFRLAALATELRAAGRPLDALDSGDQQANVRTVLSWSYRRLSAPAATLFRLLALAPGADVSIAVAASLLGVPPGSARQVFDELARAHLVSEPEPGRFTYHDLLRAYALELVHDLDPAADRDAALGRLLDHYAATAHTAAQVLAPHREPVEPLVPRPGVRPEPLSGEGAVVAWYAAELPALLAAVDRTAALGLDRHTWQLAWSLQQLLEQQGRWQDWARVYRAGLAATRRLGDRPGEAYAHRILAGAYARLGRHDEAHTHLESALDLFAQLGDRAGETLANINISQLLDLQRRPAEARPYARRALAVSRSAGYEAGQAQALNNLGWLHIQCGEPGPAVACCEEALLLFRKLNHVRGEADTLDSLGLAHHHLGHHAEAVACLTDAVELYHGAGAGFSEAGSLDRLGDVYLAAGDPDAARATWQRALALLDEPGQLQAKLDGLSEVVR
jgi:tetratricopeptide (TPR) repeat protein